MSDFTKGLEELKGMLHEQRPEIEAAFLEVLSRKNWWMKVARIPIFKKYAANAFLHATVGAAGKIKMDSERTRAIALKWTVRLFKMDNDWLPDWLYADYR